MTARPGNGKRGRPPKFGRRGRVVALTLPEEVVSGLQKINADLAWAIVTLFEKSSKRPAMSRRAPDQADLVAVGGSRSSIVLSGQSRGSSARSNPCRRSASRQPAPAVCNSRYSPPSDGP